MAMNIFPPSTTVHAGDVVQLPFYCSEPGTVVVTSSDETVATVAGSVVIPEAGPYIPIFSNHRTSYDALGQYDKQRSGGIATGPNPYCLAGQDIDKVGNIKYFNVAFRFYIYQTGYNSWHNIISVDMPSSSIATCNWAVLHNTSGLQYPYFIWRNVQNTAYYTQAPSYKLNAGVWYDIIWRYEFDTVTRLGVLKYNSNIHSPWTYNLTDLHEIGYYIEYGHDKTFSVNLCNYYYGKGSVYDIMICNNAQWTDQDVDNYINKDPIDSSKYTLYWPLKKITDQPYLVDYDRKNNIPLYVNGPHPNLTWVAHPDYAPAPYEPYTVIPTSALQPGTTLITATHANGETTTYTLTVAEALDNEQDFAQLMIYADRDGTALITMDNPIIDFPASVSVNEGKNQVAGEIIGSGTCNVTVTLNGVTDTTQFTIEGITTYVGISPDTTVAWDGSTVDIPLSASCDRLDTTVTLSSSSADLVVPASVYVNGPPVDFVAAASSYGNFVVTGEYDGNTGTADITVTDGRFVSISPDTIINELDATVYLTVEGSCPGTVALSVAPATGLTVPPTVTLSAGELRKEIACTVVALGDYVITAQFLTKTDTCTVGITEVPVLVRIGPDAEDQATINVVTNRPGTVYLSVDPPAGYALPASVVVDAMLETPVTGVFTKVGEYVVTATFRDATDDCTVNYAADSCILTGRIIDASGRPKRNVEIVLLASPTQQIVDGKMLHVDTTNCKTNLNGEFEVKLLRGAQLILVIDQISMRKAFTVPDQASVDISEL
jgi:hypothetical protein